MDAEIGKERKKHHATVTTKFTHSPNTNTNLYAESSHRFGPTGKPLHNVKIGFTTEWQ